jgi:hypothetical protein
MTAHGARFGSPRTANWRRLVGATPADSDADAVTQVLPVIRPASLDPDDDDLDAPVRPQPLGARHPAGRDLTWASHAYQANHRTSAPVSRARMMTVFGVVAATALATVVTLVGGETELPEPSPDWDDSLLIAPGVPGVDQPMPIVPPPPPSPTGPEDHGRGTAAASASVPAPMSVPAAASMSAGSVPSGTARPTSPARPGDGPAPWRTRAVPSSTRSLASASAAAPRGGGSGPPRPDRSGFLRGAGSTPGSGSPGPGAAVVSYEAEAAGNTLGGPAVARTVPGASGGRVVGGLGWLRFNAVRAVAAGRHALTVYYLSPDASAASVRVNGETVLASVTFPAGPRLRSLTVVVPLRAGVNTVQLGAGQRAAPSIDRVTVRAA